MTDQTRPAVGPLTVADVLALPVMAVGVPQVVAGEDRQVGVRQEADFPMMNDTEQPAPAPSGRVQVTARSSITEETQ